jgi:hypothetical protein
MFRFDFEGTRVVIQWLTTGSGERLSGEGCGISTPSALLGATSLTSY